MPLTKIDKLDEAIKKFRCKHPEHNPPGMIVLEPGLYEYECPACGLKQKFVVSAKPELTVYE